MSDLIFNEGYQNSKLIFEKGVDGKIIIKGKKYIDLSNCAGSIVLGHNSIFFKKKIQNYLNNNYSNFAHPNIHALNFSKNIKKIFPNFSKIVFCNSGTEAVSKSLRISRAINKKKYIVSVAGSWHGSVDQLLFQPNKNLKNKPLSSGISQYDEKNLIFIPYNDIEISKKILDKKINKINCLIIEPVQACLPLKDTSKYLKFLESYCKKNKIVLIFDEIITGLRSYNYSVQNNYKIKPDITTIGKIFGGGLPIGVIGISKNIAKKISEKNNKVFFGGTFSGNSMSAYIGNETIKYLKKNKKIFLNLNVKSKYFQDNINKFIKQNNLDLQIYRYASILRIVYTKNKLNNRIQRDFFESKNSSKIKKFRKFLFERKIYYSTSGIIFFSDKTSYKDINYVVECIKTGFKKFFK
ncbi:aminotransferase class III-fold pyridoxal phosphate-dependent enzyme [Candidatus Pelagibacter sp.]|nr:aminotransferase class III-fold pyridoxal phosphate-dependent enzyme [Candidatus Pelagibacter sp.]|tara:strand:- start:4011 stop:5237 length:1227 start_codon:yes stop_codon:yes gene_type:complete